MRERTAADCILHDMRIGSPPFGRRFAWHDECLCALGQRELSMTDLVILALMLGLYVVTAGFVRLCDRM